jgi:NTP pyrophosphatase (non-canonical NTP hydrolase)
MATLGAALDRIAPELRKWQEHNFPDQKAHYCIWGVQEELGELTHAYLKQAQGIRGFDSEAHFTERAQDALADIVIFALNLSMYDDRFALRRATYVDGNATSFEQERCRLSAVLATSDCAKIAEAAVKFANAIARLESWDLAEIVDAVWQKVKQRDWRAQNTTTGLPGVSGTATLSDNTGGGGDGKSGGG